MPRSTRSSRSSNRSVPRAIDARLIVMAKHPAPGRVKTRLPAADGGYYLIGVKASRPALFSGMRWGSDTVFTATRQRARRLGFRTHVLSPLFDVDEREDLDRLRALIARGELDLRHTARVLAR